MVTATNPSVSNANLPPLSLDQKETSTATGANTNAAASTQTQSQLQTTKPAAEQGISAEAYDANFSTTRDPASVNNNQKLMINPNSVNPNATRANVQGQMESTPSKLMLGSSDNRLAYANPASTANETASTRASDTSAPMEIAKVTKAVPPVVADIKSVGNYSQSDPKYSSDPYKFADKVLPNFGQGSTIGVQGCTITGITNALGYVADKSGLAAPTLRDTNERSPAFLTALDSGKFTNLLGNGEEVRRRDKSESPFQESIAGFSGKNSVRVPFADLAKAKDGTISAKLIKPEPSVLTAVRDSLKDGNPVILGLTKNADKSTRVVEDKWGRHTVVAIGIDKDNNIRVKDSADGKIRTLKDAAKTWGDNNIDIAYKVEVKTPKKPLTSAEEGLLHKMNEINSR